MATTEKGRQLDTERLAEEHRKAAEAIAGGRHAQRRARSQSARIDRTLRASERSADAARRVLRRAGLLR